MNITANNSEKEVVSKYFIQGKFVMDDSSSDFKEPKPNCRGRKPNPVTQKPSTSRKPVTKQRLKKLKGQNDIRSALSKNELQAYGRDFNNICRKSGIDVDSEQLQLAIALSKSLQDSEQSNASDSQKILTKKERNIKIRTVLQEYGFKVPELKDKPKRNNKIQKLREQSKLLQVTDAQRQQIISDKYSQIIFDNLNRNELNKKIIKVHKINCENVNLYHIATNISYDSIKEDRVFYIDNLIEISPNSVGSLLKDWSKIPGRPSSPVSKLPTNFELQTFHFNMDEMDLILSGPIIQAQEIINSKLINDDNKNEQLVNVSSKASIENLDGGLSPAQVRCASPDIFDEDVSSVMDNDKEYNVFLINKSFKDSHCISQLKVINTYDNITSERSNDFMDLTGCVNNLSRVSRVGKGKDTNVINGCNNYPGKIISQNSINNDTTSRKSNDSMEMTDHVCTTYNSSKLNIEKDYEKIDLTQDTSNKDEEDINIVDGNQTANKCDIETMDLTQSSNSNDTLPFVHISGQRQKNNNFDISIEANEIYDKNDGAINSDTNKTKESVQFEDFAFEHSDHESNESGSYKQNEVNNISVCHYDLTQPSSSENVSVCVADTDEIGKKNNISIDYDEIDYDDNHVEYNLGDNVCNRTTTQKTNESQYNVPIKESSCNLENSNSDSHSVIFEISDEELNYSINKSRLNHSQDDLINQIPKDNFDAGGISILSTISTNIERKSGTCNNDESVGQTNDSFLPEVLIRGHRVKPESPKRKILSAPPTPAKDASNNHYTPINTPKSSEYFIKTNQVTPMLDYENMSTPERNKELDKYGLKPFKRKRAIQLLKHLYNQTHPVVDTDDLSSPSKKQKKVSPQNTHENNNDASSRVNDIKNFDGQDNTPNVIYKESGVQNFGEIECPAEDWVFQKREKAKVHSCRIPLHIAFYNYVSSRQWLREAILRYDPVNIDVIHADLVAQGHRYDPKDLLKFLDKKCITVKTADNNTRNVRKVTKKS